MLTTRAVSLLLLQIRGFNPLLEMAELVGAKTVLMTGQIPVESAI
jgi:hypothetical protein